MSMESGGSHHEEADEAGQITQSKFKDDPLVGP